MGITKSGISAQHRLRKKFFIYPKFQLQLIAVNSLVSILAFVFVGIQAARSFLHLKQLGLEAGFPPSHVYFRFVELQANTIYFNIGIAIIAGLFVSCAVTLYLSHRLAGPIVRMKGYFRGISEKKRVEEPLRFRENDYFADLPKEINDALSAVDSGKK